MNDRKKTLIILGAGSTVSLGIPATIKHIQILLDKELKGNDLIELKEILIGLFGENNFDINDAFNIIDSNLLLGNGLFYESKNNVKHQILYADLLRVKKKLIALIFENMREKIKTRDKNQYEKLVNFYMDLAKHELTKKLSTSSEIDKRENFVANYSIVNLNWDLYSIMPIIEAHDRLNHSNGLYLDKPHVPQLRIYTDFNCEYASSNEENKKLWYPCTEPLVHAINDDKYEASRRAVLVKAYYPHGLMNMYKCPNCSKHSLYMGNLTIDNVVNQIEKDVVYKCPYCHTEIKKDDFDVLVQSNFKIRNSYLEEMRLSFQTEINNADRIIFIGYSLPSDDIELRTLFKAYASKKEVYVVLYEKGFKHGFINSKELEKNENMKHIETFENFSKVFKENLYFDYSGFPNAIDEILKIFKDDKK